MKSIYWYVMAHNLTRVLMFWEMFFQNVCKVLHGKIVLFISISLSGVRSGDANLVPYFSGDNAHPKLFRIPYDV
jgi:hypothetical protein